MKLLREVAFWKLAILLLSLLLAPQSLKDCGNNFFFPKQITVAYFTTLLIMVGTLLLAWFLVQYFSGKRQRVMQKWFIFFELSIFKTHYVKTILFCSIFIGVMASLISFAIYQYIPRVSDEIAQLFQARIFLSGHLTAPSPPLPEFFTYADDNIIVYPRWYSQYPPGFSFLLMIGLWIGSPWIINPVLAALAVTLLFLLCQELFGRETAVLSAVLFTLSPKVLFTAASLMNHTAAMFFMLLSITLLVYSVKRNNALFALCSGVSLGMFLNIRTLDAIILYIPVGIYYLIMLFSNGRKMLKLLGLWMCGFLMMALALLLYNYYTTGDSLLFGYIVRWGESHYLGFHKIRGGRIHTPLLGLINTIMQTRLTDKGLLEWVIPVSFFILMGLLFVRKTVWDWIFFSIIFLNMLLYFFWGWVDQLFMGRFYFSVTPYLIILVTRGLLCLVKMFSGNTNSEQLGQEIRQPIQALLLVGLFIIISIPVRAGDFGPQYNIPDLQVDQRLYQAVKQQKIHNAIVFIEPQDRQELIVGCGFFMNTPDLNSQNIIFAKDLGEKNKELLQLYPERKGFIYRHRKQIKKIISKGYCISPPEAFELVAID